MGYIVRRGTATRLDSKNPPTQVQEQTTVLDWTHHAPTCHMIKVDIYIHILIKFSTHFHIEHARKAMKVDIPECPTVEKLEKLMKKVIHRYQIPLRI
ncbi:unnamed protein product [Ambrosiozyma monospora]|uniref:Unnamed protein product n=1 Tax=Ambrosiozyma monospora TaxID=43982 RepID=A0A9W6YVQ7_AMBMO|nr:unnamed protein product [Ambrosiozyma monospora]